MNDHNSKISELRNKVEYRMEVDPVESRKGKGVVKEEKNEFYHVNIYDTIIVFILQYIFMPFLILIIAIKNLSHELFHEYGHQTDQNMKERLRKKLEGDEYCNNQLHKLNEKGVSYGEINYILL